MKHKKFHYALREYFCDCVKFYANADNTGLLRSGSLCSNCQYTGILPTPNREINQITANWLRTIDQMTAVERARYADSIPERYR